MSEEQQPEQTQKNQQESHLIKYEGTECVHCKEMEPLVQRLEQEKGVTVTRKECYHNEKNRQELMKAAEGKCQGIPFFLNTKTGKFICGTATYEQLVEWAKDESKVYK